MTLFEGHDYPQLIPTPAYAVPGAAAPWAHLDVAARQHLSVATVCDRLAAAHRLYAQGAPPEHPAELALVADGPAPGIARRSAVLVALFDHDGEARVVLTRRSTALRSHRGEVAFPGGRCDPGETPPTAALREAREEVGLDDAAVTVVGWLSPIFTIASSSAIQPVVGVLAGPPSLRPNPDEVERIFDVTLAELLADGNFLEQRWRRDTPRPGADEDGTFPIYFFRVPGEVVWGATGRILTELLAIVTATTPPLGPVRRAEG